MYKPTMEVFVRDRSLDSPDKERKFSTITIHTDSGVDSLVNGDTLEDASGDADADKVDRLVADVDEVDYRTIRSTGGVTRVSLDEYQKHRGEMSKFVENTVNKRKSCSLPNILDIDELCKMEENFDDLNDFNKTGDSSDLNLSFDEPEMGSSTPERIFGRGSVASLQVCGKEHMEEPCFICLKDNEIYCSVCVEVTYI